MEGQLLTLAQQKQADLVSFRVSWSQAVLFGCYEVTVSFLLVVVSMCYYKKPEGEEIKTMCGTLFPDWQSVAIICTFYTIVYLSVVLSNIWFIRQTRKKISSDVSIWIILTHPAGRLVLDLLAFFITCAFSSPPTPPLPATVLQYVNRLSMWVIEGALVLDTAFFLFFAFCVLKNAVDWLKTGTNIWTARQLAVLQLKFAVLVCYLSTHISVIVLVLLIFMTNAVVYVVWFRIMKTSRKAKQKYSNPNYQDEDENENHRIDEH
eukprot:GFUD01044675.1.p1 GENE.GFUD01044675.1~~GFUD01044675.1.p1  ORF type:complete len:263 (-),score=82.51 GFUD01044675.1:112-900(-)